MKKAVVWNGDKSIYLARKLVDGDFGIRTTASAFEGEWLSSYANGEDVFLASFFSHNRTSTRTGTTTSTERNKDHVGTIECFVDGFPAFLGSFTTLFGIATGAETFTNMDLHVGWVVMEGLCIGIDCNEFYARKTDFLHALHCRTTGATYTYHFNTCFAFHLCWFDFWHNIPRLIYY